VKPWLSAEERVVEGIRPLSLRIASSITYHNRYPGLEIGMLFFAQPLTAAATELVIACLELASDAVVNHYATPQEWAEGYPRSARCFTPALARATLRDLRAKVQLPETYALTEYHWLLLYECLRGEMAVLNDLPWPCLIERLHRLAVAQDRAYLSLLATSQDRAGFSIDFEAFIERYFWDTDVLMVAEILSQLSAKAKQYLGLSDALFGVVHGLAPHPDELVLQRVEDGEVS
jgi:hypothetical protein